MPDPQTAAALASSAIALVVPYLREAAQAGAKKIGKYAGEGADVLWQKLRDRLVASGAQSKVEKLETEPDAGKRQTIIEGELEEIFEHDHEWRDEISELVKHLGSVATTKQQMVQNGNDNIGVQASGTSTINIKGRGHGV